MRALPTTDEMYRAVTERDQRYDGIFFTGVKTTGIFCRPGCTARTPQRRNVEFFATAAEAIEEGYRACKRCRPLQPTGQPPPHIARLLTELEQNPSLRLKDEDLRARGMDPSTIRRWFKQHHGMTFHAYQRGKRIGRAIGELATGAPITAAAFGNGYDSLSGFQAALRRITGQSASRSRNAALVHLARVLTPLGPMLLGSTDDGVCLLEFADEERIDRQLERIARRLGAGFVPGHTDAGLRMEEELSEYFAGDRREFSVALRTSGTDFQNKAWQALLGIPYGTTRTYAEQARAIGAPTAVRAVARANGDNGIAIVIPCHRVIGSNGRLTGYGGGLWRKRWLLHHEGVPLRPEPEIETLALPL